MGLSCLEIRFGFGFDKDERLMGYGAKSAGLTISGKETNHELFENEDLKLYRLNNE